MGEILAFWPKNEGVKWSRKNILEIPPYPRHFLLLMNLPHRKEEF